MTEIIGSPDCGNSPKNKFVQDIAIVLEYGAGKAEQFGDTESYLAGNKLASTYDRLTVSGVSFSQSPVDAGAVRMAVLDDTCGNLIQLVQIKDAQTK
ncbi:hypothetical protein [Primorskyibacter flagellatus]|uniref:Uncharacterized protein n=1 Tax=Primorskyibacter flagellatus TaxID=1387277 RepID=A0A1W2DP54_9RHOB|nr:hypothetical protein [Primorskyibacter flagellatus]SMC99197.1 hypothetical protein SAMN06295998_11654 [Primorskyibacter flagellatus]